MADDDAQFRALKSALESARAEHRATANEVGRLVAHVEVISRGLPSLDAQLDSLTRNVTSLDASLESLQGNLGSLSRQFAAFVQEDRLARNMQFAQSSLIDVRAQRDRRFGHYESVRRSTIGMLQAMDAGVVTEAALRHAAEQLMIDTPGYWLAAGQVALAAWIRDDRELSRRALAEAVARDPDKTSLVLGLVLARYERYGGVAEWIRAYIDRQDPMDVSREFTVVLDAVVQGALGAGTRRLVRERCVAWYLQLRSDDEIVQKQVQQWRRRIAANQRQVAHEFEVLPRLAPDWTDFLHWLARAAALEQTERWLREQLAELVVVAVGLRERVDALLRSLVSSYDEEEDSLRQQELRWASVVVHGGDHAVAERDREISSDDESARSDFLTLVTTIATSPERTAASVATRRFALGLTAEWISTAAHRHAADCRDDMPTTIRLAVDGWTGDLPTDGRHDHLLLGFREFVQERVDRELGALTAVQPVLGFLGSLLFFATSLWGLSSEWPTRDIAMFLTGVAILLALVAGVWAFRTYQALPARREQVRARGARRTAAGETEIRAAAQEIQEAVDLAKSLLAHENSLDDLLREQSDAEPPSAIDEPSPPVPTDSPEHRSEPTATDPGSRDGPELAVHLPGWDLLPPTAAAPRSEPGE